MLDIESKVQAQTLVKHLLGNPRDVESLQKNPNVLLTKLGIKSMDNILMTKIINLSKGFGKMTEKGCYCDADDGHCQGDGHYEWHYDPNAKVRPVDFSVQINLNTVINNLVNQLIANENELRSFQENSSAVFAKYGIAPNQDLANLISDSLGIQQIESKEIKSKVLK